MAWLDYDGLSHFLDKLRLTFAAIGDIPSAGGTTPAMDGTGATGTSSDYARADHVHPTDTSRAPTSHASSATTYGKGTSSNYGHVKLSDSTSATTAAASGGTAATPKAVSDALAAAKSYADSNDADTTYTLTQDATDGHKITLTPSTGTATTITIPDSDTVYTHPAYATAGAAAVKVGRDATGHVVIGNAIAASDVGAAASGHTHTAANIVSWLGTTAVNRATADASGNDIASTYALKSEIAGVYHYRGSVASESALPASPATGDVYDIQAASSYGAAGMNVAWTGTAWDALGEVFSIEAITNAQIDALFS